MRKKRPCKEPNNDKKSKFDHTNKWYMQNPESVLENETYKLLWDFEIQTDPLISARRPDLVIVNKKKEKKKKKREPVSAHHRVKSKESENRDKYLDLARELNKTMEHEGEGDINCNWCARYNVQRIGKETWK